MKSGEPDAKFLPEIEEIDKLKQSGKLPLLLVLALALSLGLVALDQAPRVAQVHDER